MSRLQQSYELFIGVFVACNGNYNTAGKINSKDKAERLYTTGICKSNFIQSL